jgi:hypothetical protein
MKERVLLELMITNYSGNPQSGWVSMDRIISRTMMSSFNQRFQEWRRRGIIIKNRVKDGKSEYRLFTNPADIDRDNIRSKALQLMMEIE